MMQSYFHSLVDILKSFIPEDAELGCGYWIFKLGPDHPFTRVCSLHDWEFGEAHEGRGDKSIHEVDWDLFYRWTLIAKAQETPEARCTLAEQICALWMLARIGGKLLWDGSSISVQVKQSSQENVKSAESQS